MKDDREKWARVRIIMIGTFFGLLFLIVTGRAFYLQILQHEEMVKRADKQHQRIVPLTPARGAIMDRNGTPLAVSVEMDSCYGEPRHIQDVEGTAAVLAPLLGTPKNELVKKLSAGKGFVWLERRLTPEIALRVQEHEIARHRFCQGEQALLSQCGDRVTRDRFHRSGSQRPGRDRAQI